MVLVVDDGTDQIFSSRTLEMSKQQQRDFQTSIFGLRLLWGHQGHEHEGLEVWSELSRARMSLLSATYLGPFIYPTI